MVLCKSEEIDAILVYANSNEPLGDNRPEYYVQSSELPAVAISLIEHPSGPEIHPLVLPFAALYQLKLFVELKIKLLSYYLRAAPRPTPIRRHPVQEAPRRMYKWGVQLTNIRDPVPRATHCCDGSPHAGEAS